MDFVTLKKKLSTYVSAKGYFTNVSDEVLYEVLVAWENWTGASKEFYRGIGFSHTQMAGMIGKAKKLKREGHFGLSLSSTSEILYVSAFTRGQTVTCIFSL